MKLKVIGSGAILTSYNSSCYLIDDTILFDIPNGTCKELRRLNINPSDIQHILITHFHGDHYFDIPFYLLGKTTNKLKDKSIIYTSKDGIKKIKQTLKLTFPNTIKKMYEKTEIIFNTNKKIEINNYNIEKILVDHGNMKPAYGYIFESNNKKVGFTGDTNYCDAINYMASTCDYLICDCTFIKGNNKHMGIDNIETLSKKYNSCIFYTTHMNDETREKLETLNIKNLKILNDKDELIF